MRGSRLAAVLRPIILFGGAACAACATTPSTPEPSRPPNVPGLVPLPSDPTPLPSALEPRLAGSSTGASPTSRATENRPAPPIREAGCAARVGAHVVKRSALNRTLDAGLGTWLRGVDVEPKIDRGRFQGWLVRGLHAGDPCWVDIDLRAGDVVNRVNRLPIERPEEAQAVWNALRAADEIVIDLVRAGKPRTLRFDIRDDRE